jgi:hypothetical protein
MEERFWFYTRRTRNNKVYRYMEKKNYRIREKKYPIPPRAIRKSRNGMMLSFSLLPPLVNSIHKATHSLAKRQKRMKKEKGKKEKKGMFSKG